MKGGNQYNVNMISLFKCNTVGVFAGRRSNTETFIGEQKKKHIRKHD